MARIGRDSAARVVDRHLRLRETLRGPAPATRWDPDAKPPVPGAYVAISRHHYCQASLISAEVAGRLGYTLYDRELLEAVAEDARLRTQLIERLDERHLTDIDGMISSIINPSSSAHAEYTRSLIRVLRSLGEVGDMVVVGRGAHLILPPDRGLRVHLVAPMAKRLDRFREQTGIDERQAPGRLRELDRSSENWLKRTFPTPDGVDPLYDLELNTDSYSVEESADLIVRALWAKCPESRSEEA